MLLAFAAALPLLFWDAPADSASLLRDAGIVEVSVPATRLDEWKYVSGLRVEAASPDAAIPLSPPTVDYQANRGGATTAPWVIANGWQFARHPQGRFVYDARGPQSALAAAEAFAWRVSAIIRSDAAGLKPLADMLEFLRAVPPSDLPPLADIGFLDDGSETAAEVMNMLTRGNLLFRPVAANSPRAKITVRLGSKDYPADILRDPAAAAQQIRFNLRDERRSVRIYGTQVVLARVSAADERLRVELLNYAGERRRVDGIRVRVLGRFTRNRARIAGSTENQLLDFTTDADATEFTIRELKTYAFIDLSR